LLYFQKYWVFGLYPSSESYSNYLNNWSTLYTIFQSFCCSLLSESMAFLMGLSTENPLLLISLSVHLLAHRSWALVCSSLYYASLKQVSEVLLDMQSMPQLLLHWNWHEWKILIIMISITWLTQNICLKKLKKQLII
jgi:hypothetical protein